MEYYLLVLGMSNLILSIGVCPQKIKQFWKDPLFSADRSAKYIFQYCQFMFHMDHSFFYTTKIQVNQSYIYSVVFKPLFVSLYLHSVHRPVFLQCLMRWRSTYLHPNNLIDLENRNLFQFAWILSKLKPVGTNINM